MTDINTDFVPFLSCAVAEAKSRQSFKDLPIGALFVNINDVAFAKISATEAVNLYTQIVVNFGAREYENFDGQKFTFSDIDTPVFLLKFYA